MAVAECLNLKAWDEKKTVTVKRLRALDHKLRAGWCVIKMLHKYVGSSDIRVLKVNVASNTLSAIYWHCYFLFCYLVALLAAFNKTKESLYSVPRLLQTSKVNGGNPGSRLHWSLPNWWTTPQSGNLVSPSHDNSDFSWIVSAPVKGIAGPV